MATPKVQLIKDLGCGSGAFVASDDPSSRKRPATANGVADERPQPSGETAAEQPDEA